MEKEPLDYSANACRIDLMVGGGVSKASGFIYITNNPFCNYDYVMTAKHTFEENYGELYINRLQALEISWIGEDGMLKTRKVDDEQLDKDILFMDNCDLVIIKIEKLYLPKAKPIAVKNFTDVKVDSKMDSWSFPAISRNECTRIYYKFKDKEKGLAFCKYPIKNIENFEGISGCGVYLQQKPFLVSVVAGYSKHNFELNEICLSQIDWDEVNDVLRRQGWETLLKEDTKKQRITKERDIIDLRELEINGAKLNMEIAIRNLRHDLTDDWYFDPLDYVDVCNSDFVLDYFSVRKMRERYRPERPEIYYIPKRSLVLRKAMVGTFIDRLVYMAVVTQLAPTIERHINKRVFSARYNRSKNAKSLIVNGVEQWTKKNYLLASWIETESKGCLVNLDILNYYDTINKQILISQLGEIVSTPNEKACVELLTTWLNNSGKVEETHGIPQNSDASSLLATFYLSRVDEDIQIKTEHYCRFMDDMYFIAEDIYKARDIMQSIEKMLRELDLSLNAQKVKFVRLDNKEKKDYLGELSLFDYEKSMINVLMRSSSKANRMNGVAMVSDLIGKALSAASSATDTEKDSSRSLKFSANVLTPSRLKLTSHNDNDQFFNKLHDLANQQVDIPEQTPLFCKLMGSFCSKRDTTELNNTIVDIVLRKKVGIYEWQAYHLWMLLAYLKCNDKRLMKFAQIEIDRNDETKRVEVAAIMIYMATVNPEYSRILLQKLRAGQLHGNLQKRCALVACRALDTDAIDDEVIKKLSTPLRKYIQYLNKHKEKDLVFFHRISSYEMERSENLLFPEYYSGL